MGYSSNAPSVGLKTGMELRFLLLLLCISGFEAQEFDAVVSRVEGQRLIVECRYNYWDYSAMLKSWCQLRDEKCFPLVSTSYTSYGYRNKATFGRATIEDHTGNRIVTITMEKLQVQDSGVYWCARYYPPNTMYPLMTIKLDVSKEVQEYDAIEGQSLSVQCPYNIQDYKEVKKAWCRRKATTTSVVPVTSSTGHTSLVLSTASAGVTPADSSLSNERNFIILGVVLGVLFILALIGLVILCTQKSKQLKTRGDGQAEAIYEEPRNDTVSQGFGNMYDPKDDKQELPQDLKYATLAFKSRPSPRESVYANITPSRALETPHTRAPTEPVEYASISLKPLASGAKSWS
ncbi:triggering receptor expressed on myeloid cells 1-like isoform X3 [Gopherus evgoodei]|uniref:triggering receptor expressed on myeloid cells 1-like isoform X3 n=1 Tax=Gopherus evgoodei TaxID=1825980 RepID=UPI0011CFE1BA|nr:triggering receptor expressed on myeloid cells 1-like isoform X3 [Gopherus evgoodei]